MRIDSNAKVKAGTAEHPAAAKSSTGEAPDADGADLSPDQARVDALTAQVGALPEMGMERVAALQSAVKQGLYNVSDQQTAEALMSEMSTRERPRRNGGEKAPTKARTAKAARSAEPTVRRDSHEGEEASQDFFPSASGIELAVDAGTSDCS